MSDETKRVVNYPLSVAHPENLCLDTLPFVKYLNRATGFFSGKAFIPGRRSRRFLSVIAATPVIERIELA